MYNVTKDLLDTYISFTDEAVLLAVIDMIGRGVPNDAVLQYLNLPEDSWQEVMAMYSRASTHSVKAIADYYEELVVLLEETADELADEPQALTGELSWSDADFFDTDY